VNPLKKVLITILLVILVVLFLFLSTDYLNSPVQEFTESDTVPPSGQTTPPKASSSKRYRFVQAGQFAQGMAPVHDGTAWGYIDKSGTWVIQPQFQAAYPFSGTLARVKKNGEWGYINQSGEPVIDTDYGFSYRSGYSQGLAIVTRNQRWGFLNERGDTVIPLQYQWAAEFSEGLARVQKDDKQGFINSKGTVVIPFKYDDARNFSNGLAPAKVDGRWGYVDRKGNWSIQPRFTWAKQFHQGRAPVRLDGEWGYVDRTGRIVIEPRFGYAGEFVNGRALIQLNGRYGFITPEGSLVVDPEYIAAGRFSDGRARVFDGDAWGYIDRDGTQVISPIYDMVTNFSDSAALVYAEGNWSYLTPDGKQLLGKIAPGSQHEGDNTTSYRLARLENLISLTDWYHPGGQGYHSPMGSGPSAETYPVWELGRYPASGRFGGYKFTRFPYENPTGLQHETAETLLLLSKTMAERKELFDFRNKPYGYRKMVPPGLFSSFVNMNYLEDKSFLDPDRPEILNYYPTPDTRKLVGFAYTSRSYGKAPTVGGSLIPWQYTYYNNTIVERCHQGKQPILIHDTKCDDLKPVHHSQMALFTFFVKVPDGPFGRNPRPEPDFVKQLMNDRVLNDEALVTFMTCRTCVRNGD
jgi:hypothetical protein